MIIGHPLYNWNTKQNILTVGGFLINTGLVDGYVKITPEKAWEKVNGIDGSATRYSTGNHGAEIQIKLKHTGPGNIILTNLYNADILSPNGAGICSFQWCNLLGAFRYSANSVYVAKHPDLEGNA